MGKKELQVAAIENGTVIDHIPSEKTYEVARLLHLTDIDVPTLIGYNLPSKRLGRKGIIKITNKYFTDPTFDFATFAQVAKFNEGITVTLDHILKNLKMDCATCSFKDICDTIEGMRDIHKREEYHF